MGRVNYWGHILLDVATGRFLRDTLIVSGFWRSGTTWLMTRSANLLKAKSFFEPFSPESGYVGHFPPCETRNANAQMFMPLNLDTLGPNGNLILKRLATGYSRGGMPYFLRESLSRSASLTTVPKFTQISFILPEVAELLDASVLHVRRDPAAVYASLMNVRWAWTPADICLAKMFEGLDLSNDQEAAQTFETLKRYDDTPLRRIVALWALSERKAYQAGANSPKIEIVQYEDLITDQDLLLTVLSELGFKIQGEDIFEQPSGVTELNRLDISISDRQHGLSDKLSHAERDEIQTIVSELFPEALEPA